MPKSHLVLAGTLLTSGLVLTACSSGSDDASTATEETTGPETGPDGAILRDPEGAAGALGGAIGDANDEMTGTLAKLKNQMSVRLAPFESRYEELQEEAEDSEDSSIDRILGDLGARIDEARSTMTGLLVDDAAARERFEGVIGEVEQLIERAEVRLSGGG